MSNRDRTMHKDAIISPCGKYRYLLQRSWDAQLQAVCFIMLNPSTADANVDDPTIRRCLGFAKTLGFGQLEVCNLFGLRATDPLELKKHADPVGNPANDEQLLVSAKTCHLVICAWGTLGVLRSRNAEVLAMLRGAGIAPHALRISKHGHPTHPLYLPANLTPKELT